MSRLLGGGCLHSPAITVGDQVNFVWNTKMDISMEVLLWQGLYCIYVGAELEISLLVRGTKQYV